MATPYTIENILVAREDANGDVVANPAVLQLCLSENTIKETETYTELMCLLVEGKTKTPEKKEVAGALGFRMESGVMSFVLPSVLGKKTSVAETTSDTWTADQAQVVGDIVNTTDNLWSLRVTSITGLGEVGPTEPVITEIGKVVDNEVTWVATRKLFTQVISLNTDVPKFRLEIQLKKTSDSSIFTKQYTGAELSALPVVGKADDDYNLSIDVAGARGVDELDTAWSGQLSDEAGAQIIDSSREYIGGSCELLSVLINDAIDATREFEITVDKGLTTEDLINCKKETDRDVTADGTLVKAFTATDYYLFKERESFDAKVTISNKQGHSILYHFPKVVPEMTDPDYESKTKVLISPAVSAEAPDTSTALITVTATLPALYDNLGVLYGDGTWY